MHFYGYRVIRIYYAKKNADIKAMPKRLKAEHIRKFIIDG